MRQSKLPPEAPKARAWRLEGRRLYFSRELERRCFFVLTLILLLAGILYRIGCFA